MGSFTNLHYPVAVGSDSSCARCPSRSSDVPGLASPCARGWSGGLERRGRGGDEKPPLCQLAKEGTKDPGQYLKPLGSGAPPSFKFFEGIKGFLGSFCLPVPTGCGGKRLDNAESFPSSVRSGLPSPAPGTAVLISCKLKICRCPELERAELAGTRENRPECGGDRLSRRGHLSGEGRGDWSSASGCGLQTPTSSSEPPPRHRAPRGGSVICLIGIVQINLAAPTIKCGVERALKSCASPPATPQGSETPPWQLVSVRTGLEGPRLLGSCRPSGAGVGCALLGTGSACCKDQSL